MLCYLASQSPRRCELLKQMGLPFQQLAVNIDETWKGETPDCYCRRMALEKGAAALEKLTKDDLVIAADTIVILDNQVLGKPSSPAAAHSMLKKLSGQSHQVMTVVAIMSQDEQHSALASTQVTFREISDKELKSYLATREPYDKAGAYAIQGYAAVFVQAMRGCYSTVVGLPVYETSQLLEKFNIHLADYWPNEAHCV